MSTFGMKLPPELWSGVLRETGTIQDESEIPPLGDEMNPAIWEEAFQIKLPLALVSRSWHSVSVLIPGVQVVSTHGHSCEVNQTVG